MVLSWAAVRCAGCVVSSSRSLLPFFTASVDTSASASTVTAAEVVNSVPADDAAPSVSV
jgi:hypothetical protein